nr:ribonuclease H-like domain-containing protein [Tanacetum cinerariifolium]
MDVIGYPDENEGPNEKEDPSDAAIIGEHMYAVGHPDENEGPNEKSEMQELYDQPQEFADRGYDLLALVDGFTPVEDNTGLLETRFDEESICVFVFPEDVIGLVNLTPLSLYFGVTATNLTLELLMLRQPVPFDERHFGLQIEQYFHVQDYALWDVIENGNSFVLLTQTKTVEGGDITTKISSPITAEEKIKKNNDVKARSMLLMALPNEHLMTFNQYKDAKSLFVAIETRFGGNEAKKKTQKTLLNQMYENFSASSTESLDFIFNWLQKIVSQLAVLGEFISHEDLNLKFLKSLPSEWNTNVVVWRNKPDLDTMSIDDLYDNFKIVEQEVKGTASSNSSSQNMAFVSSPSTNNTNEVYNAYGKTRKKININGSYTVAFDKSKVECYNRHKMGHFARECRGSRNQDSRNRYQDSYRRTVHVEETPSKAMVAINGVGFDWSYMAEDEILVLKAMKLLKSNMMI